MNVGLARLIVAFVVTACAGALMISRFAFYSFKSVSAGARVRFTQIVLVPLAFVFIFLFLPISLLLIFGGYALVRAERVAVPQAVSSPHPRRADARMNRALRGQYLAALGLECWTLRRGAGGERACAGAVCASVGTRG